MFDELHSSFARVRIAALQSEVTARTEPSTTVVMRRRSNSKVTPIYTQGGDVKLAKRRVIRAKREYEPVNHEQAASSSSDSG
ncbi:hypothetical protein HJFPF1_05250 [Paramyrothecium foliicola]|nr:hypothetical protein HJFPF1_05250 [Paramyrothecium foliicola]